MLFPILSTFYNALDLEKSSLFSGNRPDIILFLSNPYTLFSQKTNGNGKVHIETAYF